MCVCVCHMCACVTQEAIQRVEGSGVGEWGSSLTQMASAAAEMVSSGGAAGLQPAAAVEAASQQLRQVVELLASAPQGKANPLYTRTHTRIHRHTHARTHRQVF